MARIEEKIAFIEDLSGLEKTSEALLKLDEQAQETISNYRRAIAEATGATEEYNKELRANTQNAAKANVEAKRFNDEQKKGRRTLRDRIRGVNILGNSLGGLVDTYRNARKEGASFGQAFGRVGKQVGGSTRLFAVARAGLAGLAVGAAVAIGKLVTGSQQFQDGFDDLKAQVGAGARVVRDRLVNLGGALKGVFNRPFGETLKQIGNSFRGIGNELSREIALAKALERAFRNLRRESSLLNAERASTDLRIRQLKLVIDDTTAAYGERIAANQRAFDLERDLNEREAASAQERLSLLLGDLTRTGSGEGQAISTFFADQFRDAAQAFQSETDSLAAALGSGGVDFEGVRSFLDERGQDNTDEAVNEVISAYQELQGVQQRSIELQTEYNNSFNSISQEATDRAREARERLLEVERDLLAARQAINNELRDTEELEGVAAINRRRDIALEQVQALEDQARAAFQAANVAFDQEEAFVELRRRVNERATREITEFEFEQSRERIEQSRQAQEQEIELINAITDETLTLEEFRAKEQLRIRREALQALRQVAVEQFGADSDEVLNIDVQIAQNEREGVAGEQSREQRVRQELLRTAELRKQVGLAEVDLIEETGDKTVSLETFKQQRRLELEIEFLRRRRELIEGEASQLELELVDRQIEGLEQNLAALDNVDLSPLDRIKQGIIDALNIDDETFNVLAQQVSGIFNNLANGVTANVDRQISEYDRLLNELNAQIQETQSSLQEQQQLQEDGFANDVETFEAKLEEEQALRAQALEKKQALERKAAQQQLIVDAAQQASALALAAAQLIASEASKGLVGIILAAAGLASLFSLFNRAKAEAAQSAANIPEFREGGPLVNGPVIGPKHDKGGVFLRDKQHKLYNIEGGEFVTNAQMSGRYSGALDAINSGLMDRLDPNSALDLLGKRAVSDVGRKIKEGYYPTDRPGMDYERLRGIQREATREMVEAMYDQPFFATINGELIEVKRTKFKTSIKKRRV